MAEIRKIARFSIAGLNIGDLSGNVRALSLAL